MEHFFTMFLRQFMVASPSESALQSTLGDSKFEGTTCPAAVVGLLTDSLAILLKDFGDRHMGDVGGREPRIWVTFGYFPAPSFFKLTMIWI
jgi:hypothetical protein